jgi:hypothetical protein
MDKYTVVDYFDVWGNTEDGWEVNNLAKVGEIEVQDYTNYIEIVDKLMDIEYFAFGNKEDVVAQLEIYNDYDMIEIFRKDNDMPICRLERVLN